MPSGEALARMYGPAYSELGDPYAGVADPKQPERVLEWLAHREVGTFVDFGCGSGKLLVGARRLGWQAVGVEFDGHVTQCVAAETGCRCAGARWVGGLAARTGRRDSPR